MNFIFFVGAKETKITRCSYTTIHISNIITVYTSPNPKDLILWGAER